MDDFVFYVVVACASNDNITYQHAKYPSLFYANQFNQLNSHFLFCIKKKKSITFIFLPCFFVTHVCGYKKVIMQR